ncbi:MAG TPA: type II toxin-antitoxin system VapC family toxin [Gammaproteobacteria bacterium]|jgi:tRNA(fMet)-specific endonuclease VapC|nr:type II toxin-antitoxin system VapC family toxin [Gammaproteobacteria bacterium]
MRVMLDTNICIYIIKQHPESVLNHFKRFSVGDIYISSITYAELNFGVQKSTHHQKNKMALSAFTAPLEVISFDDEAARYYGELRAMLEKQGKPIGSLDMLIAAHALSMDLTLITNNMKEFKRVPHLKLQDWTERA